MLRGLLLKPSGREGKRGGMRKGKEEKEREGRKGKEVQSPFNPALTTSAIEINR